VPLAYIARLSYEVTERLTFPHTAGVATFIHKPESADAPPTCTRLSDGTGVWVVRFDATLRRLAFYCPTRHPQFYDPFGPA
jgi:hypothetical protein